MSKPLSVVVAVVFLTQLATGCATSAAFNLARLPTPSEGNGAGMLPLPGLGEGPFAVLRPPAPACTQAIAGKSGSFVCRSTQDCLDQLEGSDWVCSRSSTYSTGTCVSTYQGGGGYSSGGSSAGGGGDFNWLLAGVVAVGAVVVLVALDREIAANCADTGC